MIDQSMFAENYQGYAGWEESRSETLIPAFGISAYNICNFIGGHIVFSFAGPIAIAEAWRPERATSPWLNWFGLVVAMVLYAGAASLILLDPSSHSASPTQLIVSGSLVIACVAVAVLLGRRVPKLAAKPTDRLSPLVVLAVSFVIALTSSFGEETWSGAALGLGGACVMIAAILGISRRHEWTVRHTAAVALGYLLIRGLLAFTYFPLLGEVEPLDKYIHNVTMLGIVTVAGIFSLRRYVPRT